MEITTAVSPNQGTSNTSTNFYGDTYYDEDIGLLHSFSRSRLQPHRHLISLMFFIHS